MTEQQDDADQPPISPEVVQAIFSGLMNTDPDTLERLEDAGVTRAEYLRAVSLFGEGAHLALDHHERELEAMKVLIGDRKLTEGAGWPELFDGLSAERAGQLRDLYDALPDGGRAEYDRRFGRPEEI